MSDFVICLSLGMVFLGAFMLVRNEFVFRVCKHFIWNRPFPQECDLLPDYEEMVENPKYWLLWTPRHWEAWVQRRMS